MQLLFEGGGGQELDAATQLLKQSINLQVFIAETPRANSAQFRETMPSVAVAAVLVPGAAEPTTVESVDLLDSLLDVVTAAAQPGKPAAVFEWWWTIVTTSYLVLFYPEVMKNVGVLDLADTYGFPCCPPPIQAALLKRLEMWRSNKMISEWLWNPSRGNLTFCMEVLKQATELQLSHHDTIAKALEVFYYHLIYHRDASIINDAVADEKWAQLVEFSGNIIKAEPVPRFSEYHSKLILTVLASYEHLTLNLTNTISRGTWRHLQFILLDATITFLHRHQANMLSDNKNDIVRNAEDIIATLFNVWVRSPVTTDEMWNDFHKYFSSVSDWPHAIRQWRGLVHKLTDILVKFVYTDHPVVIRLSADKPRAGTTSGSAVVPLIDTKSASSANILSYPSSSRSTIDPTGTPKIIHSSRSARRLSTTPSTPKASSPSNAGASSSASTSDPVASTETSAAESSAPSNASPSKPEETSSSAPTEVSPSKDVPSPETSNTTEVEVPPPTEEIGPLSTSAADASAEPEKPLDPNTIIYTVTREQFISQFAGVSDWSRERIQSMWRTIINIVGNVNGIKSSLNFELAMRCISDVVSKLLEAETRIPLDQDYRRIPPIETFFPWVMEACFATGEKIRGVIIAFQILCQLFCTQHATPLSPTLVAHFYRAIQVGLSNDNPMVRDQILTEARHIFSFGLPGVHVLIPDLLREIASIFKSRSAVPEVQKHAMTLFNSLLCYVNHHKDINIPDIVKIHQLAQQHTSQQLSANSSTVHTPSESPVPSPSPTPPPTAPYGGDANNNNNKDPVIASAELRDTMATLLISFLNNNMDPSAKGHILWGACIMLFDEIRNENPRMAITTQCLQAVLFLARHPHDGVAVNAANVLTSLADFFPSFNALDKNLPFSIISLISDTIAHTFTNNGQPPPLRESVLVALFESLTAWLSAGPNDFLRDKAQAVRVFNAIELGLFGQTVESSKIGGSSSAQGGSSSPSLSTLSSLPRISNDEDYLTCHIPYLLAQLRERPSHNSVAIKNAAETALCTVLELMNNFPTPAGATMIDSASTVEMEDLPVAFFSNNNEQLFSVQIVGHPRAEQATESLTPTEATMVRVIVRDSMGKHCWDIALDYRESPQFPKSGLFDDPIASMVKPPAAEVVPKRTDLLSTLLSKYDEKHLDCLPQTPKFSKFTLPPNPHESYAADIEAIKSAIVDTNENDAKLWGSYKETRPEVNDLVTDAPDPVSPHMSLARIALSHLGFLTPQSRRHFHLVSDSPDLRKAIAALDKLSAREQHSISVRYLADGEERRIIKSPSEASTMSKTSPLFQKFVAGLGWKVDISNHKGFKGHLDATSSPTATYHATAATEVLFEVINDLKQEEVAFNAATQNLVEIVWSEHKRDYAAEFPLIQGLSGVSARSEPSKQILRLDSARGPVSITAPSTPASGNNSSVVPTLSAINNAAASNAPKACLDVSIGIYPLPNGQFRISVLKRELLANWVMGPLLHGMVVSPPILSTLVRLTACFARKRAVTARNNMQAKSPRVQRLYALKQLSTEFRAPRAGELFLSCLYPLADFPETGVCSAIPAGHTAAGALRGSKPLASARTGAESVRGSVSASYVPGVVGAAASEAAEAEAKAKAEAEAKAKAAAESESPSSDPNDPNATSSANASAPASPSGAKMVKQTSRAYGVSRSAGSGRSLGELAKLQQIQLQQQQAQYLAQQQALQAQQAQQQQSANGTPRANDSPRPVSPTTPPPPPAEPIEEVVLPAMNTAPSTTSLDISPFDDPTPAPPPSDEPAPTTPSQPENSNAQTTSTAPENTITAPPATATGPTDSLPPAGNRMPASFKINRPPAATVSGGTAPAPAKEPVASSPSSSSAPQTNVAPTEVSSAEKDEKKESVAAPATTPQASPSAPAANTPSNTSTAPAEQKPAAERMAARPPAVSNPVVPAPGTAPASGAPPKNFGGPAKIPGGFKVPYGVGAYKMPAGVPKSGPAPPAATPSPNTPSTQ